MRSFKQVFSFHACVFRARILQCMSLVGDLIAELYTPPSVLIWQSSQTPCNNLGACGEKGRWSSLLYRSWVYVQRKSDGLGLSAEKRRRLSLRIACMCGGRCPDPSGYVARCVVDSAIVAVAIISCSNLLCGTRKGEGTDG